MKRALMSVVTVSAIALGGAYVSLPLPALEAQNAPAAQGRQPPESDMPQMMKMHQQMMAEMQADNARLDDLVTKMNAATGEAREDAIVAVLTELVRQHQARHMRMGQMQQRMMRGRGMMQQR